MVLHCAPCAPIAAHTWHHPGSSRHARHARQHTHSCTNRSPKQRRDNKRQDRAWMPLTISHELMRDFALVAPRQTRWSYSVPGVDDGGARSFTDAKHAIEAAYKRTWSRMLSSTPECQDSLFRAPYYRSSPFFYRSSPVSIPLLTTASGSDTMSPRCRCAATAEPGFRLTTEDRHMAVLIFIACALSGLAIARPIISTFRALGV